MKKIILISSTLLFLTFAVSLPVMAQTVDYTPLAPIPGVSTDEIELGTYLQQIFNLGIRLAIILAVLMLVIGGIQYSVSEALGEKEAAIKRMKAAVGGLLLAIASILIIQTINPDLLSLDFIVPEANESGN